MRGEEKRGKESRDEGKVRGEGRRCEVRKGRQRRKVRGEERGGNVR